jgi:hypothetical protein
VTAILLLAAAPLRAQAEARFVLVVTGGIPPYLRGELRLSRQGQAWRGTLAMEDRDSLLVVTGIRITGDSLLFEAPLLGGMRFRGRQHDANFAGEAAAADGVARDWTGNRLSDAQEYYPSPPRFTLRQIVIGGVRGSGALPAPLSALLLPARQADSLYRSRAAAANWPALDGAALASDRGSRVLGLLDRTATLAAQRAALSAIADGITDLAVRRRFTALFHPAGSWVIDVHDAALRFAVLAQPTFRLEAIGPALRSLGDPVTDSASVEQLLAAAYRLVQLRASDAAAWSALLTATDSAAPSSRRSLLTLLSSYDAALDWYGDALRFLLTEGWLPAGLPARTVSGLVRAVPLGAADSLPAIRARLLGYAQAYPHIRTPDDWVDSLVRPDNPNARDWLAHHGRGDLLLVLRRLPATFDSGTVVAEGRDEYRVSTIGLAAAQRETGFLEPADEIVIEPGLAPLLAVQTVVHEWIHILHERARERAGLAWRIGSGGTARYQPVTPLLAEGLAEWEAERALAPLIARLPLIGVFEAEKRAAMAAETPDDAHLLGYRMAGGMATRVADSTLIRLLVRHGDDPEGLARESELIGRSGKLAKSAPAGALPDSTSALIPEIRFAIDDETPEVIGARLVVPIRHEKR